MGKLELAINEILKTGKGTSIVLEIDTKSYLEANIKTITELQKNGLSGVFVSVQRPFKNISSLLEKEGVDLNKIIFIDIASAAAKETQEERKGGVHISPELDVDELVKAIYTSLEKMKGKRFVFIDSLTTFALYKPVSETLRFSEFLMRMVKDEKDIIDEKKIILILIFNVAKDLTNKKFIQDVVLHADKIIEVKI